jgi:hypothetical protein
MTSWYCGQLQFVFKDLQVAKVCLSFDLICGYRSHQLMLQVILQRINSWGAACWDCMELLFLIGLWWPVFIETSCCIDEVFFCELLRWFLSISLAHYKVLNWISWGPDWSRYVFWKLVYLLTGLARFHFGRAWSPGLMFPCRFKCFLSACLASGGVEDRIHVALVTTLLKKRGYCGSLHWPVSFLLTRNNAIELNSRKLWAKGFLHVLEMLSFLNLSVAI